MVASSASRLAPRLCRMIGAHAPLPVYTGRAPRIARPILMPAASDNTGQSLRRLRADAARNRERVLSAARLAFAELGLEAPLDEIARRAGVGAGTVHRHFPTKESLYEAALLVNHAEMSARASELGAERDPGDAFFTFFSETVERGLLNRGLADAL